MARRNRQNNKEPGCGFYLFIIIVVVLNAWYDGVEKKSPEAGVARGRAAADPSETMIKNSTDEQIVDQARKGNLAEVIDQAKGRTAMHLAAQLNRHELIKKLAENGEKVSPRDKGNATPLHIALEKGNAEAAEVLLKAGADLKATTRNGYTILHHAARYHNYNVARAAVKAGANVSADAFGGFTPLHYAARENQLKIAILLCENGADLNATISQGWSPGDLAFSKSKEITRYLQSRGARFSQQQLINEFKLVDGWPFFDNREIIGFPDSNNPVFAAVDKDSVPELEELKSLGVDFEISNRAGTPLLCLAIANAKLQAADFLLKNAADLAACDANGKNALLYAIEFRQKELAIKIITARANLSHADQSGNTALHYALATSQNDIAAQLVNHGADIFAENNFAQGMIHIASENSNSAMFEVLICNGCDVNQEDIRGNTPLHLATEKNNIPIITALLKNGADFAVVNNSGKTALKLAKSDEARALLSNRFEIEGQNPAERQKPAEVNILPQSGR